MWAARALSNITYGNSEWREKARQAGARPGDRLLLTQPLGTGVVLAADMQGHACGAWVEAAHAAMQHTNDVAGRLAITLGAHAATELTESNFDAEVFDSGKNAFGA